MCLANMCHFRRQTVENYGAFITGQWMGKKKYKEKEPTLWGRILAWAYRRQMKEPELKHKLMASHSISSDRKSRKVKI